MLPARLEPRSLLSVHGAVVGLVALICFLRSAAPQHIACLSGVNQGGCVLLEKEALAHELPGGAPDRSYEAAVSPVAFPER